LSSLGPVPLDQPAQRLAAADAVEAHLERVLPAREYAIDIAVDEPARICVCLVRVIGSVYSCSPRSARQGGSNLRAASPKPGGCTVPLTVLVTAASPCDADATTSTMSGPRRSRGS
jgi:hypothetical protein